MVARSKITVLSEAISDQLQHSPTDKADEGHIEEATPSTEFVSTPKTMDCNADEDSGGGADEATRLQKLSATVRDQNDLEQDIGRQADQMLTEQADERDEKRLSKTSAQKEKLKLQIQKLQARLRQPSNATASVRIRAEMDDLKNQITELDKDLSAIKQRMDERHQRREDDVENTEAKTNQRMAGETRRDFLIRTGKITPFSKLGQMLKPSDSLADVMLDAEEFDDEPYEEADAQDEHVMQPLSHTNLLRPGYEEEPTSILDSVVEEFDLRPRKKRKLINGSQAKDCRQQADQDVDKQVAEDEYVPREDAGDEVFDDSGSDFGVVFEGTDGQTKNTGRKHKRAKRTQIEDADNSPEDLAGIDDGNEQVYQSRLRKWSNGRKMARRKAREQAKGELEQHNGTAQDLNGYTEVGESTDEQEWRMPHPARLSTELDGGLLVPGDIYPSLFDYQKTGVQWLWELYSQQVGGIIGDEMGLGKTIQIISFLASLHHSGKYDKPTIVVAPATVMKQWVDEFHRWWPAFRVSILHTSGSGMLDVRNESQLDDELDSFGFARSTSAKSGASSKSAKKIVDRVLSEGHILVTTYSGLQTYASLLIPQDWGYAVLDEGHKIRNPNTAITIYCKELRTPNRVILSGTPMQNNLTELWSLFDFVYPMRLGTLVNFRTQFEIPIKQGGYANASNLQVETAYNCAETLKEAISPYLLQRFKVDVAADLPKKSEQVLFCKLTKPQRTAYESFLASADMSAISEGKRHALYGIDILRKICNHPDLVDHKILADKPGYLYGQANKSGKMQVVKTLVQLWKETGHKTLLFAQHRIMLDILEPFLKSLSGLRYLRMDGTTPISTRQSLVDTFNNDQSIDLFLLTTKVGGLGVNLTGADRVIIYDPDWNPSTDVQARERAWRLGQKREVMIYRLMTAGTIEEKIYHRQIFKQFLTNKILRDPKQRQTFQLKDLHDLFVLGDANENETETSGLFKGTEVKFPSANAKDPVEASDQVNGDAIDTDQDASKISSMPGVSHQAPFHNSSPPPTAAPPQETTSSKSLLTETTSRAKQTNNPDRLLSTLFSRSDIHSAHEHDAIMSNTSNSSKALAADPEIISREARRVAAQAAKELKRAGEEARSVPVGVPTWTGTVGVAGRPESETSSARGSPAPYRGGLASRGRGGARGGLSSAAVLANLSARQGHANGTSTEQAQDQDQPKGKDFLALIRSYLLTHGGRVPTRMLIDHFNRFCGTPQRTLEFKEMLREIAVLEKAPREGRDGARGGHSHNWASGRGGLQSRIQARAERRAGHAEERGGRGIWVLKKEFGGAA